MLLLLCAAHAAGGARSKGGCIKEEDEEEEEEEDRKDGQGWENDEEQVHPSQKQPGHATQNYIKGVQTKRIRNTHGNGKASQTPTWRAAADLSTALYEPRPNLHDTRTDTVA